MENLPPKALKYLKVLHLLCAISKELSLSNHRVALAAGQGGC